MPKKIDKPITRIPDIFVGNKIATIEVKQAWARMCVYCNKGSKRCQCIMGVFVSRPLHGKYYHVRKGVKCGKMKRNGEICRNLTKNSTGYCRFHQKKDYN